MIVDFHTHCFPDFLAERAMAALSEQGSIKSYTNGTVSNLKETMKQNNINHSVVLQIATKPSQVVAVNNWAIETGKDNITVFGSIHPLYENWKSELDRIAAAGVKGIKLHPEYQNFYVDDDIMLPMYEHIGKLGLILSFHAGADIAFPPPVRCSPERLMKCHDYLPSGKTILAHMGGWEMWDKVDCILRDTHFIYDTAFCYKFIDPEQMKHIIQNHGADKIVMGSDSPWEDQSDTLRLIKSLNLSAEDESAIFGGNAVKLLGL